MVERVGYSDLLTGYILTCLFLRTQYPHQCFVYCSHGTTGRQRYSQHSGRLV
jgi:hypothetical protein